MEQSIDMKEQARIYKVLKKDLIIATDNYKKLREEYIEKNKENTTVEEKRKNISLFMLLSLCAMALVAGFTFGTSQQAISSILSFLTVGGLPCVIFYGIASSGIRNRNRSLREKSLISLNSNYSSISSIAKECRKTRKILKSNHVDITALDRMVDNEVEAEKFTNQSIGGLEFFEKQIAPKSTQSVTQNNSEIESMQVEKEQCR